MKNSDYSIILGIFVFTMSVLLLTATVTAEGITLKFKNEKAESYTKNNKDYESIKKQLALKKQMNDMKKATNEKIQKEQEEMKKINKINSKSFTVEEKFNHESSYYKKALEQRKTDDVKFNKIKETKTKMAESIVKKLEKFQSENPSGKKVSIRDLPNKK